MPVALITGAAQGIGKAIALRLANDGLDVALNDIPEKATLLEELAKEIQALGRKTSIVTADVSSEEAVEGMVKKTVEELGSLDVMIANAGISILAPFAMLPADAFDKVMAVNVRGTFLCFKYASQQMIAQGKGGVMIAACSSGGKRGFPYGSAYSASKFAIRGLTQSAAFEFGRQGIRVNAYAPSIVDTEMGKVGGDAMLKQLESTVALPDRALGKPEDIANLVSYLCTEQARLITGQTLSVDAGLMVD